MSLAIIDSGGSNISSVIYALRRLGAEPVFTRDPAVIRGADRVILPGVGAAAAAMAQLREADLVSCIRELRQPVLGICLGAQLLAKALGGAVTRNPVREIGWYDVELTEEGKSDPVLSTFAPRQEVFQWHEDGIRLPPRVTHLASSPASPVQAFRHGEHAYGFQFHLEVDGSLIERWLTVPDNQGVLNAERGHIEPDAILRHTPGSIDALQALSRETFSRWIDRFELGPRRRALPSR